MDAKTGRIGLDAVITLIAMAMIIPALSTLYSTAVVAVGRAAAVFMMP